jgi:hypothetical protein
MTVVRQNLLALAAMLLVAGGCAHGNTTLDDAGMQDDRTFIRVMNNNWSDMTIYLVRGGMQRRLGTVTSQTSHTFVVPTYLTSTANDVRLLADPIGSSRGFASPAIMLNPGQTAEWQLENSLALSSVWVR